MKNKDNFLEERIEIPKGVSIEKDKDTITVKKDDKVISKKIDKEIPIKMGKNVIECKYEKTDKKMKKKIKTAFAHISSILKGLEKNYEYKLQVCFVHFPITVSLEGDTFIIKNFLGERKERTAKILPEVDVKIEGEIITIQSYNKEKAGQSAANIENACKVKNKDRRVFQDGIYMIEKAKGRHAK
jgi:large subunit ribosomal protein L6